MTNPNFSGGNPEHFTIPTDQQLGEIVDLALLYSGFVETQYSTALQQDISVVPQFVDPQDVTRKYTFSGSVSAEVAFSSAMFDQDTPTSVINYVVRRDGPRRVIERSTPSLREDTPAALADLEYLFEASADEDKVAREFEAAIGMNKVDWTEAENLVQILRRLRRES